MAIHDELHIDAPIERVWELTVDVERWPELTSTVRSVERLDDGPFGLGSRARISQPRQRPTVWTVTRFEPPHAFEWETSVLGARLVGTHHLAVEGEGCRNVLGVEVADTLAGRAVRHLLGSMMHRAIRTENEGFKAAAERA